MRNQHPLTYFIQAYRGAGIGAGIKARPTLCRPKREGE